MREQAGGAAYHLDYSGGADRSDPAHLVATMDAVTAWPEVVALREWERTHLALGQGDRLLDVGCGPGDVALALGADLGPAGEVVGVDASAEMLRTARARASNAAVRARFVQGDAEALPEPDGSFDAVRSERVLQWVADPDRAVREMHRVLRPGGRLSLIDTDWSTLVLETGDEVLTAAVRDHVRQERRRPSTIGGRLWNLCLAAGFVDLAGTAATHVWTRWDPDTEPVPDGFFSIESLAADLVASGHVAPSGGPAFVDAVHDAARTGRFFMAVTIFATRATRPTTS